MERVIAYMTSLDPAYPSTIEGASPEELEELVELSGQLPASYRAFLERMGRSSGKLRVPFADLGVEQALRFYREGAWELPESCRFLGKHDNFPFADYYLDGRVKGPEPLVVQYSAEGPFTPPHVWDVYATLEEMLLSTAFTEIRMKSLPRRARCSPSGQLTRPRAAEEPLAEALHRLAERLGFTPIAGTGPFAPCYEGGAAAMMGYQAPPHGGMIVDVAAADRETLVRLVEMLADHLALVPS